MKSCKRALLYLRRKKTRTALLFLLLFVLSLSLAVGVSANSSRKSNAVRVFFLRKYNSARLVVFIASASLFQCMALPMLRLNRMLIGWYYFTSPALFRYSAIPYKINF